MKRHNTFFLGLILLCGLFCPVAGQLNAQDVRINEFMASNASTLSDEDGDFSDWIELYNSGEIAVSLQGWVLTDDVNDNQKWVFPEVQIPAKGCLIVFASDKNRKSNPSGLHSNFKLTAGGEYLALLDAQGQFKSRFYPAYPEQYTDVSYGFVEGQYVYMTVPSPGSEPESIGELQLRVPSFDTPRGLFETPFQLAIVNPVSGANIRYTLDGSTPSATNGSIYNGLIPIQTTTVVRAVLEKEGWLSSRVVTQSYIFPDDVVNQPNSIPGYPAEWGPFSDSKLTGLLPADYEMDPELTSDPAEAERIREGLRDLPTLSLVTDANHLFSHEKDPVLGGIYIYTGPYGGYGSGWERPISFELIDSKRGLHSQIDCGIRMQGQASRLNEKNPKHSFIVLFKGEYGSKKWDFPLFSDGSNTEHNKLVLRAGFGDSWTHWAHSDRVISSNQSDIWAKDMHRAMGHASPTSAFAHLYINGLYWGVYAPSERLDKDFAEAYLDGSEDDFDVIKNSYTEVVDGNSTMMRYLFGLAQKPSITNDVYQQLMGNFPDGTRNPDANALVDMDNFIDYMLVNFYGGNTDWDGHNWVAMYNRVNPGKGFQFMCWDAENMLEYVNDSRVSAVNNNSPTQLLQKLMTNPTFKRRFQDRVQKHCYNGGLLTPENTAAIWFKRSDEIRKAMHAEAARWGDNRRDVFNYGNDAAYLYNVPDFWNPRQTYMETEYFPKRTDIFVKQLTNVGYFPSVSAPEIRVNGIAPTEETYDVGDAVELTVGEGQIVYTLDGTDPIDWSAGNLPTKEWTLVAQESDKRVLVPSSDIGTSWRNLAYDDASWGLVLGAPGGVGYSSNASMLALISHDLRNQMSSSAVNPNTTCYLRVPFEIADTVLSQIERLRLLIQYDDGFAAYLNGVQVTSSNIPAVLNWNASAPEANVASGWVEIDLTESIKHLRVGKNVLALHGLNKNTGSSDFLLLPKLLAGNQRITNQRVSETASFYAGSFELEHSVHIKARSYSNGSWSAMTDRSLRIAADYNDLKMTEIQYHPLGSDSLTDTEYEFIELKNTGKATLDLSGLYFDMGVSFAFPDGHSLLPDSFVVLSSNERAFYDRYNLFPDGEYDGQLSNSGETLRLMRWDDVPLMQIAYEDANGWTTMADGMGYSLVPVHANPYENQNLAHTWRASYDIGGSPGKDDQASVVSSETSERIWNDAFEGNVPNPFQYGTELLYTLEADARVDLTVFSITGQVVARPVAEWQTSGRHRVQWSATDARGNELPAGIYFCRLDIKGSQRSASFTAKLVKRGN